MISRNILWKMFCSGKMCIFMQFHEKRSEKHPFDNLALKLFFDWKIIKILWSLHLYFHTVLMSRRNGFIFKLGSGTVNLICWKIILKSLLRWLNLKFISNFVMARPKCENLNYWLRKKRHTKRFFITILIW